MNRIRWCPSVTWSADAPSPLMTIGVELALSYESTQHGLPRTRPPGSTSSPIWKLYFDFISPTQLTSTWEREAQGTIRIGPRLVSSDIAIGVESTGSGSRAV